MTKNNTSQFISPNEKGNNFVGAFATISTILGITGTIGNLISGGPTFYKFPKNAQNEAIRIAIINTMDKSGQAKLAQDENGVINADTLIKSMTAYLKKDGWSLTDQINHEIKMETGFDPISEAPGALNIKTGKMIFKYKNVIPVLNTVFSELKAQEKEYKAGANTEEETGFDFANIFSSIQPQNLKKIAVFGGLGFLLLIALIFSTGK